MKFFKVFFVFVLTLSLFLPSFNSSKIKAATLEGSKAISEIFPDGNAAKVIAMTLEKTINDQVTQAELDSVPNVYLYEPIANLEGVQYLRNLTSFGYVSYPAIGDHTPLASLTQLVSLSVSELEQTNFEFLNLIPRTLKSLVLGESKIQDLSIVSRFTELTSLSVDGMHVTDISAVANLVALKTLNLVNINAIDITPLSNLTALMSLRIQVQDTTSLVPLSNLSSLVLLELSGKTTDLAPLSNLISLQSLAINRTASADISALANLTSLKKLELRGNDITDISPLVNLSELEILDIGENDISDASPLQSLSKLTVLFYDDTKMNLNNYSVITGLTNLSELFLSKNNIENLQPLGNMPNLKLLDVSHNSAANITGLNTLTNIYDLRYSNNSVENVDVFTPLINLGRLSLNSNKIIDFSPLKSLINLVQLDLSENNISDGGAANDFPNLKSLYLNGNKIRDISNLLSFTERNDFFTLSVEAQSNLILDKNISDGNFSIQNNVIGLNGELVPINYISNFGVRDGNKISWTSLVGTPELHYISSEKYENGSFAVTKFSVVTNIHATHTVTPPVVADKLHPTGFESNLIFNVSSLITLLGISTVLIKKRNIF